MNLQLLEKIMLLPQLLLKQCIQIQVIVAFFAPTARINVHLFRSKIDVLILDPIITYWTTRQIARNEKVGKTSVISSSIFSLFAIPAYLILVYSVSLTSNAQLEPMILGAILIPVFFVSDILASINRGHKPYAQSYGLFVFEIVKIPAALALVFFLELGVYGAILATLVAYIIRIIVQAYYAKEKIKEKFNLKTLRRWLKLSWIPLYMNISKFVESSNVLAYTIITGSVLGIAYYTVSLSITHLVKHSAKITEGLYPKLLAGGDYQHVKENFSLLLYRRVGRSGDGLPGPLVPDGGSLAARPS